MQAVPEPTLPPCPPYPPPPPPPPCPPYPSLRIAGTVINDDKDSKL